MVENFFAKSMTVLLLACCSVSVGQEDTDKSKKTPETKAEVESADSKLYWVFLTTGNSTEGVEKERIQEMQAAHLANFKSLAEQEKLLTAGPMSDPEKRLRGIVVVRAKNLDELKSMFGEDPYVQKGYLKIEATEMSFEHGVINTKITPQGLDEFRMVVLEKTSSADEFSDADTKANQAFIADMSSDEELLLTVFLPKADFNRTAVLIMAKGESDQPINEKVNNIPAVKAGVWKSKIFPIYMGKGSLKSS